MSNDLTMSWENNKLDYLIIGKRYIIELKEDCEIIGRKNELYNYVFGTLTMIFSNSNSKYSKMTPSIKDEFILIDDVLIKIADIKNVITDSYIYNFR